MDDAEVVPELAVAADLPSLVVTCADAFSDDAMIRWPMPEATPAMLQELFRVILTPYVESGVLWKIGGCDGGAAWLPPDVPPPSWKPAPRATCRSISPSASRSSMSNELPTAGPRSGLCRPRADPCVALGERGCGLVDQVNDRGRL
jgi:hypothetical protein